MADTVQPILHIANGESTAGTLRDSSLAGEVVSWKEALIDGPTPGGVDDEVWRDVRAHHLSDTYGVELEACSKELRAQETLLEGLANRREVVLWFDEDLFCQANLLFILGRFDEEGRCAQKTSLVCVDRVIGVEDFRGLGELNPDQLSSLFPGRSVLTRSEIALGAAAWSALCAPDPTMIEDVLRGDLWRLPGAELSLRAHMRRFPSVRNGLGRIEEAILRSIDTAGSVRPGSHAAFGPIFRAFANAAPEYGLGDLQVWSALQHLASGPRPLVEISSPVPGPSDPTRPESRGTGEGADRERPREGLDSPKPSPAPSIHDAIHEAAFRLTEDGKAVLEGRADAVAMNGIDRWIGGVRLMPDSIWRWDEASGVLVRSMGVSG